MPLETKIARDPGTIELTPTQVDNYLVRPENFTVRRYSDPITAAFHGQSTNDPEAAKRSMEKLNTGSIRAEGDVNEAGPPHTKTSNGEHS